MKGSARRLVLKQRQKGIRKWPIVQTSVYGLCGLGLGYARKFHIKKQLIADATPIFVQLLVLLMSFRFYFGKRKTSFF